MIHLDFSHEMNDVDQNDTEGDALDASETEGSCYNTLHDCVQALCVNCVSQFG